MQKIKKNKRVMLESIIIGGPNETGKSELHPIFPAWSGGNIREVSLYFLYFYISLSNTLFKKNKKLW